MSDPVDQKLAVNLRRWQASGQPEAWCAARAGLGTEQDWHDLLASLWWSDFWPMDTSAVRALLVEQAKPSNLRRWRESGQPLRWIERHTGAWDHAAWLDLVASLEQSEFWPLDPDAVGALLEELRAPWRNLRRWKQSGQPQRWVESLRGCWNHADWLALVEDLRQSEFWPLELTAVGEMLEEVKQAYRNLQRWQASGHAQRWVELRQGSWDHNAWLALLDALRHSEFWPLEPSAVGRVVEEMRREWWNLRRWRDSGLARRWVEAHQGQWGHGDWLALLASLKSSGFWPGSPAALGQVLEEARDQWHNLRRWQESGQPSHWVLEHAGDWTRDDLDYLLDTLWQSEFWPLDARAVQGVLEATADALTSESPTAIYPFARAPRDEFRRAA
jgi:hypothetical protein